MENNLQEKMKELRSNLFYSLLKAEELIELPEFSEGSNQRNNMNNIISNLRLSLYQELYLTRDYLNIKHTSKDL